MDDNFRFTAERERMAKDIVATYPERRAAIIPLLWLVREQEGCVPQSAAKAVAEFAGVTAAEIHEAMSFYKLFSSESKGIYHIQVCMGPCCHLKDSDLILEHLKDKLGIDVGSTTMDNRFGLSTCECLGWCGTAPAIRINEECFENLTTKMIDEIVERLSG